MARESSRANALLVELLLVIFFFMISAAILVQLFANARHKSMQAQYATAAISEAQNCAEDLYAANDGWEDWLTKNGFRKESENKWARTYTDEKNNPLYTICITADFEPVTDGKGGEVVGEMRTFRITGHGDGQDLFTIPSARYAPAPLTPAESADPKEVSP